MDMLHPSSVIEIPSDNRQTFRGITFDGCFFYMTVPRECAIYKFNREFEVVNVVKVDKPYTAICYDASEKVLWAATDKPDVIYKLNRGLKEIGQLHIKTDKKLCDPIVGLSYDCKKNVLLAAYLDFIAEISKKNGCVHMLNADCPGDYSAVLSIAPYYAVVCQNTCKNKKRQDILFYTDEGCLIRHLYIDAKYKIVNLLFYPCKTKNKSDFELIILASDICGRPVILRYAMKVCGMNPDCCNYKVCKEKCEDDDDKTCDQACNDLLQSVALVEAALAHILNAEGEKLQKATSIAKTTCELLEVNKSISNAIVGAAHLEFLLLQKLEVINSICSKIKKEENKKWL
ncbi:MAG: hypothetical protein FWE91_05780 [Defluviitaleaceae bacterium]|nr:hypothetical protein [Defluviitaleaceae bacterium]MCL2835341.1 hypothetical protein [Defluviitaleaceae bacterium]